MNQCSVKAENSVDPSPCGWRIDWFLGGLCPVVFALVCWNIVSPIPQLAHRNWPEGVLLLVATAATLSSYSRTLPFQNVFWAALVIAVIATLISAISVLTGVPFGSFVYTDAAGPKLFGTVPVVVPFVWILFIFVSRGTARLILRPWRQAPLYGIWMIGLTALLSLLLDVGFEPFASGAKHYWTWQSNASSLATDGAPILNFVGWLITSLIILAFVTPMWLNKKPGTEPKEFGTLGIWMMLNLLFATAAAKNHFWATFSVTSVSAATVLCLAVLGGKKELHRRTATL